MKDAGYRKALNTELSDEIIISDKLVETRHVNLSGAPLVQCWKVDNRSFDCFKHTILPLPYIHFVFPLSGSVHLNQEASFSSPFVAPILFSSLEIELDAHAEVFGFVVDPACMTDVLGFPIAELNKNIVRLEDFFGHERLDRILEIVHGKETFLQKASEIEKFFGILYLKKFESAHLLRHTIDLMKASDNFCLSDHARSVNCSTRWLQQLFADHVGLSPGTFYNIIKFNKLLVSISKESYRSLTLSALESGYYDQSHCIRQVKRFSGRTPSELVKDYPLLSRVFNRV